MKSIYLILHFLLPREDDTANAPLLDASESPVKDSLLDGAAIKWIIWDSSHSGYLITENLISPDQHMDIRELFEFCSIQLNDFCGQLVARPVRDVKCWVAETTPTCTPPSPRSGCRSRACCQCPGLCTTGLPSSGPHSRCCPSSCCNIQRSQMELSDSLIMTMGKDKTHLGEKDPPPHG